MKAVLVVLAVALLCASASALEMSAELDASLAQMTETEEMHSIVSTLQAEAESVKSANGVERLVKLLQKVLRRLQATMKRGAKSAKRAATVCKKSVNSERATTVVTRDELRVRGVRRGIHANTVIKSKNDAASLNEKIGKSAATATAWDAKIKQAQSDLAGAVAKITLSNKELSDLIALLRKIDATLTSNGLVEVASQLGEAAKTSSLDAEASTMLIAIAAKAEAGTDVSDIHDLIQLLIHALAGDLASGQKRIAQLQQESAAFIKTLVASADAERANGKMLIAKRDSAIKNGDASQKSILALDVEIKALTATITASKARLALLKKSCSSAKKAWVTKRTSFLRQIRVIKHIIRMLRNKKMSASVVQRIASVKLDYPVWKTGAWSECSAECGLGKKTRSVSCSGRKCRGNQPRASASCTNGACAADCIVSRWTAYSECSRACGGGIKSRSRKVLAQAAAGGKACPAPSGLKDVQACNLKACGAKKSRKRAVKKQASPTKKSVAANAQPSRAAGVVKKANPKKVRAFKRVAKKLTKKLKATKKWIRKLKQRSQKFVNALKNKTYKNQQQWVQITNKLKKIASKLDKLKLKVGTIKTKKFIAVQKGWQWSKKGRKAVWACQVKAGFKRGSAALQACLQDARMTGNNRKAVAAAKRTNKVQKKAKKTRAKPCVVSAWSKWGACSTRCGGGVSKRTRIVRLQAEDGGQKCPGLEETQKCNMQPCPVDCQLTAWSAWSACTKKCAGGTQFQTRSVKVKDAFGGAACPTSMRQERACNTQACPPPPRPKESVSNDCLPGNCPVPPPMRRNVDGAPSRTATHNGDPHLTNYNGDFFHPQSNGIYTATATKDGLFEVQWFQDGFTNQHGTGGWSVVQDCKIRYKGNVYNNNFNQDGFVVNCQGSQWTITMPGNYQGQTAGACGENRASWGAWNFQNKAGDNVDVQWKAGGGAQVWGLAGYAGTGSKLGRWFVGWKPSMEKCMYGSARCAQNLANSERAVNNGCNFCSAWGCFSACGSM